MSSSYFRSLRKSVLLLPLCLTLACHQSVRSDAASSPPVAKRSAPRWKLVADIDTAQQAPDAAIGENKVVTGHAGTYREGGRNLFDRFVYLFKISGPNRLLRLTVEHPDDAPRVTKVTPTFPEWPSIDAAGVERQPLGSGFISGLQFRLSNQMVKREYLFTSPQQQLGIIIETGLQDQPAAVGHIKLEEAEAGDSYGPATPLPLLGAKLHRRAGLYWEDPVMAQNFSGWAGTDETRWTQVFGHTLDYLDWSGQDLLVYPIYWYSRALYRSKFEGDLTDNGKPFWEGGTSWAKWPYGLRNHPADFHKIMARECSKRGVAFIPALNMFKFDTLWPLVYPANEKVEGDTSRKKAIAGEESVLAVNRKGEMLWTESWGTPPLANILHPRVQKEAMKIVDEIASDLGKESSFGGIQLQLWRVSPWALGSGGSTENDWMMVSYDDYSVTQFCKENHLVPPGEPRSAERFKQRADWILNDAGRRQAWIDWRAGRLTAFYFGIAERLKKAKPTAKLHLNFWYPNPIQMEPLKPTPAEQIKMNGFDIAALSKNPNIVIDRGVEQLGARARQHKKIGAIFDKYAMAPIYQKPFMGLPQVATTIHQQYFESHGVLPPMAAAGTPQLALPEPWKFEANGREAQPLPVGRNFLEFYARSVYLFDPRSIAIGGFTVGIHGAENEAREFAVAFRSLPETKFTHVDSNGAVEFRTADAEGSRWYYAVNITDSEAELPLNVRGILKDAVTGQAVSAPGGRFTATLKPFELKAWRADTKTVVTVTPL